MSSDVLEAAPSNYFGFYEGPVAPETAARLAQLAVGKPVELAVASEVTPDRPALLEQVREIGVAFSRESYRLRAAILGRAARDAVADNAELHLVADIGQLWQKNAAQFEARGIIDTKEAWLDDLFRAMLRRRKIVVHVNTPEPRSVEQIDSTNRIVELWSSNDWPVASLAFAKMLRAVHPTSDVHVHGFAQDYRDPSTGKIFSKDVGDQSTGLGVEYLARNGVMNPEDVTGAATVVRARDAVPLVETLIARLGAEQRAHVVTAKDGGVYLRPTLAGLQAIGQTNPIKAGKLLAEGLCLKHANGVPSAAALEAASLLMVDAGDRAVHLFVASAGDRDAVADVSAILRLSGLLRRDQYQILVTDSHVKADVQAYLLVKLLSMELSGFAIALNRYHDMQAMDPYHYIKHNYGSEVQAHEWGILPEDRQIIERLTQTLPKYLLLGQKRKAINIGHGPFSYLDHALAPYVESIEAADPAYSNQFVIQQAKAGILDPQYDVGGRFEALFAHHDSKLYTGCDKRAKEKLVVTDKGIYDMPDGAYDIVAESFVSCSISFSKADFWEYIRAKQKALRPDGLMLALHMVGSEGWSAGGDFPSVKLSQEEIKQAYWDAGLEILECVSVQAPERAREGYDGMAMIIARRRRTTHDTA